MSIIEQAAERLERLKQAGVDVPTVTPRPIAQEPSDAPVNTPAAEPPKATPPKKHSRRVTVDIDRLRAAGIVTPDEPNSKIAGEFRVIKRPLIANAQGKGVPAVRRGNLIMVTSSLANEGKTFVTVNLALSIAMELDTTVLLVDGDVLAPAVMGTLGLEKSKGLIDLLTSPTLDVSDVLLKTDIDRLSVLPSGTLHERSSELLASDAMVRLIDELATRYPDRIILFDSPPLLATTESRSLASHMGQIVLVVEADRTVRSTFEDALAKVEFCPVVMTVLNKAVESELGSYYHYYRSGDGSRK
ncbi:MAG: XrtA-associated tyrosine autokinase [Polyangiales bacterium]